MTIVSSSSSSMLQRKEEDHEPLASLPPKKRRNPNTSYPDVDIIALSPTTLMAKNRFICEICFKGFPREQNLQLHKRGHNLPFNLKQTTPKIDVKRKRYTCPDPSCIHHNPSRALGDLTGIKKHYSRKHCEKRYKCGKCPKMYAVQADLKAHTKACGKKEYHCHCGILFSRHDSYTTHRAFCEAMAGGGLLLGGPTNGAGSSINTQMSLSLTNNSTSTGTGINALSLQSLIHTSVPQSSQNNNMVRHPMGFNCYRPSIPPFDQQNRYKHFDARFFDMNDGAAATRPQPSAAALLRKASLLGSNWSNWSNRSNYNNTNYFSSRYHAGPSMVNLNAGVAYEQENCHHSGAVVTRDFLGVGEGRNVSNDEPNCST